MLCTFKGRRALWTKRNKADFGEFIQLSNTDKLRINFGLFVKAKNCSVVIHFHDLFPIKNGDGVVNDRTVNKILYVPLFHVTPGVKSSFVRFAPECLYIPLSLNYWAGPSRNLKLGVSALQSFIEGLGDITGEKLGEILTGVEKAYAA